MRLYCQRDQPSSFFISLQGRQEYLPPLTPPKDTSSQGICPHNPGQTKKSRTLQDGRP